MSIVTPDGGLTALGYALCGIAALALLLAAAVLAKRSRSGKRLSTKQLVFCAAAMALSFITSYMKIWTMPYGGSVTLFSMLFICLIGYWYGPRTGILTGLAYGILQFLQEPYVLSLFQVCCDYVLAFAGLGLAGVFHKSKHGLVKGYILGILVRGAFHALGGYLYWMDYMPESFPQTLASLYPIIYNYSYILAEGVITVIVISLPPVAKALAQVKKNALE
ncbi:energy-coupled thiamine transporter ThiT [Lacrimispora sp. 210928-DFI.3.58]|uniref:energy-coupled thiamine transporter ThiT n=1 Tax=Lacrimispora sp. 210928-DFI.3.58 TaxID=2883214 RepID=UPI0015B703CF|nr:energy-coupled thiamine transporter ThiT [Lacrimispora sp. 210928-DFI.3.58]MCB7319687.1 energy-coupled thiamine transporter ThiT [Lacrimispora sp. 210928-DFI.3.58]